VAVPVPSEKTNFQWGQLESTDFHQYMENLRAIGCPPETVRDLVIAEVNKMFAPRFTALASQMQRYENWRGGKRSLDGLRQQLQALQKEKRDLLLALLGIDRDPQERWANLTIDGMAELGRYAFLPADKEPQVREIMEKYKELEAGRRSGDLMGTPDSGKKLREERRAELAKVLTPEELYEMDVRDSNAADSVRSRFGGADLSEEEYRKLFALRKAYEDEQGAVADYSDPEKVRRRSEARKQLDENYKSTLGDERYAQIQKEQDASWRGLTSVAQQFNLPQSTVDQAYQYQQVASQQMSALLSDPSISSDKRPELMKQIQKELDDQLSALMGNGPYAQYKKSSPQFYLSSGGGDTVVLSGPGPVPIPAAPNGAIQQRIISTVDGSGQGQTRVTIQVP